jgi:O-antigen/teichoic acid export membrane protein
MQFDKLLVTSYLNFVAWLLPASLSLITPILLMRDLGVEGFGIYALLISIALLFTIADLSMDAFLIPKIAKEKNKRELVIIQSMCFFTLAALLVFILSGLCFYVFRTLNLFNLGSLTNLQLLLIALFTASQLLVTSSYIEAMGSGSLNSYSTMTLYVNLGNFVAIIMMHLAGILIVESLLLCRIITNLLIGGRSIKAEAVYRYTKSLNSFFDHKVFAFMKIALLGKIISLVTFNFDKILIATYLTVRDVGLVAYPMQLGLAIVMGASKLCAPLQPVSANVDGKVGSSDMDSTVKSFLNILVLDVGAVVILISLWLPNLVPIIYGGVVDESEISFQFAIILLGFWLVSLSAIAANILPGWSRMGLNVFSATVRGCITILVMFLSIQSIGIFAVGLALLFAGIWDVCFLVWFLFTSGMPSAGKRALQSLCFMLTIMIILIPSKYLFIKHDFILTSVVSFMLVAILAFSLLNTLRKKV